MKEEWRDVIGYEGLYKVSSLGRIKRLTRISYRGHSYNKQSLKERILKPVISFKKYLNIGLIKNKKRKMLLIHRIIAMAFIENKENKKYINHKDGNKLNNSIDNLEWVTSSDNSLHAFRLGLRSHVGEKNSRAILTIKDVILIRKIIKCGFSDIEIGFMFGVNPATIYKIKNKINWNHI